MLQEKIPFQEVEQAVKCLRYGKAPGPDGVWNEMIKYGGQVVFTMLLHAFNDIIKGGQVPKEWQDSVTTMIHKGGDRELLTNYRGICVSNVGKRFAKVVKTRLEASVEERGILGRMQHGFRCGVGSMDAIFVMNQILDVYSSRQPLYIAFLDIQKAYDSEQRRIGDMEEH